VQRKSRGLSQFAFVSANTVNVMFKYSFNEGEYSGGYLCAQCVGGETDIALMIYCIILDH